MDRTKLMSGRANISLARATAKRLGLKLVEVDFKDFANTEMQPQVKENIRGFHIYIFQTAAANAGKSVNDYIVELLLLIQTCKLADAASVTIVLPCYPYSRSDKKDVPRVPIAGSMLARIYETLGVHRIITIDAHAGQIQGFSPVVPMDNLYTIKLFIEHIQKTFFTGLTPEHINDRFVLASADVGGAKRIEAYAKRMKIKHVLMHKHRDYDKVNTVLNTILIGDPNVIKGKKVFIIDDIIDTGGTMISAAEELVKNGATSVLLGAPHGVFSGQAIEKLNNCKVIEGVIVSNSLPQEENQQKMSKLQVVDLSGLLADTITRLRTSGSVSELFE